MSEWQFYTMVAVLGGGLLGVWIWSLVKSKGRRAALKKDWLK